MGAVGLVVVVVVVVVAVDGGVFVGEIGVVVDGEVETCDEVR